MVSDARYLQAVPPQCRFFSCHLMRNYSSRQDGYARQTPTYLPVIPRFDSHDHTSGHLTQLLANDTAHVRGAVADSFGQISQSVAAIGLALGLAFANGWKLALVVLATMPLLLLIIGVQVALITSLASKVGLLPDFPSSHTACCVQLGGSSICCDAMFLGS